MRYRLKAPAKDCIRGRIYYRLKDAGDQGATKGELAVAAGDGQRSEDIVVQTSVYGIRQIGYKVDFEAGRYYLRGKGVSFTRYSKTGPAVPVSQRKKVAKKVKRVKAAVEAPKAKSSFLAAKKPITIGAGIFHIHHDKLTKALAVLPHKPRQGLLNLSKKVHAYNTGVQDFLEANEKVTATLAQLSDD